MLSQPPAKAKAKARAKAKAKAKARAKAKTGGVTSEGFAPSQTARSNTRNTLSRAKRCRARTPRSTARNFAKGASIPVENWANSNARIATSHTTSVEQTKSVITNRLRTGLTSLMTVSVKGSKASLRRCVRLECKRLWVNKKSQQVRLDMVAHVPTNCTGTTPKRMVISSSSNRGTAYLN